MRRNRLAFVSDDGSAGLVLRDSISLETTRLRVSNTANPFVGCARRVRWLLRTSERKLSWHENGGGQLGRNDVAIFRHCCEPEAPGFCDSSRPGRAGNVWAGFQLGWRREGPGECY